MTGKFRKVASHSAPEPAFGLFLNLPEGTSPLCSGPHRAIGTAVVGWMLEFSGYVGTNATQPQSALNMMQFMYLWLPLIFDVLIMFVLSRMNVEGANKKLKAEKGITADEVTDASDMD